MRAMLIALSLLIAVCVLAPPGVAVEPDEMLDDPILEGRARDISKLLRCLVCQNQSIDDSNADLARDLRVVVRERLVAGATNAQVIAFVTARYGDFVLLKPPFKPVTYLLWLGPAVVLVAGVVAIIVVLRRRPDSEANEATPLTDEEEKRLAHLMTDDAPP